MKQLRVKGHALEAEGRRRCCFSYGGGYGKGHCSCGLSSPDLPSTAARQRWHRAHKQEAAKKGDSHGN
jgi:hypothetical protein